MPGLGATLRHHGSRPFGFSNCLQLLPMTHGYREEVSRANRAAATRTTSNWETFAELEGTYLRWRRRGLWDHDLLDESGLPALCSVQKLPFKRLTMTLRGRPCQLRGRGGPKASEWVLVNASGHKVLSVTGNPVWQTNDPVVKLQRGEEIIFTIDKRSPSRAVMSCINMRSNAVIARFRWRSRGWWRPLSTVEVVVESEIDLTEPIVGLVMLASVDFLPQFFNHGGGGIGLGA